MYKFRYANNEIEFNWNRSYSFPLSIIFNGIELTYGNFVNKHGWGWRNTASGIYVYYSNEDGKISVSVPKQKFLNAVR